MQKSIGCVAAMLCAMGISVEVAVAGNNSSLAPLIHCSTKSRQTSTSPKET
ncbi:hypothetical protein GALL_168450 [mine drainage metagenome]|uniref:Uncharacterized protein n=1 Tax=mine drainage metagenome TaxID=410659 RepID=A0A1J5SAG4_9ZZZZ